MPDDKSTFKDRESILDLDVKAKQEEIAKQVEEDLEKKAKDTTKTGRKSKDAKDAENIQVLIGIIEPVLLGVETAIASKLPEFSHSEEERKTISTLGAPVLNKYVDLDAIKYEEEARFLSYLFMCELPKAKACIARIKKEQSEKKRQAEEEIEEGINKADLEHNEQ